MSPQVGCGSGPPQAVRRFLLAAVALGLALGAWQLWLFGSFGGFVAAVDHCEKYACDFENHFYPMGQAIFAERRPVAAFVYPPFAAFLFGVFGIFSYSTAVSLWTGVQVLLAASLFLAARPSVTRDGAPLVLAYLGAFLTSMALLHNTKWGQVSVGMTLSVLGAFALQRRGRSVAGGSLLAVGFAFKLYAGLFLLHFVLCRDRRFLAAFATTSFALLVVAPLAVLGVDGSLAYYSVIADRIPRLTQEFVSRENTQYAPAVASRLVLGTFDPRWSVTRWLQWSSWLVALANFLGLCAVWRSRVGPLGERAAAITFLSLPFLLPVTWPHYMVYLPYCQLQLARRASAADRTQRLRRVGLLALAGASALLASSFAYALAGGWSAYARGGALLGADALLIAGLWLDALWERRRSRVAMPRR